MYIHIPTCMYMPYALLAALFVFKNVLYIQPNTASCCHSDTLNNEKAKLTINTKNSRMHET